MKKKISKLIIISLVISSFAFGGILNAKSTNAFANENVAVEETAVSAEDISIGKRSVELALELEKAHPIREAGTKEEAEMAKTLAKLLEENNFSKVSDGYISEFLYAPAFTAQSPAVTRNKTSQNVFGYINNNKEQTIIIGAHYDSYSDDEKAGNTGFYSNLLGVTTSLEIAKELAKNENLDFNILVAFWGAEEDGYCGSEYFVSGLSNAELANVALYVNLDTIAVGDNLYIFTNEIPDLHENAFLKEAENLGHELKKSPEDKGYCIPMFYERPFMHRGISSDNYHFTINEVMCANFLSYVWDGGASRESLSRKNILYTKNDNSEHIFSLHEREEIENNVDEVSEIIVATLSRGDIIPLLKESKEATQTKEIYYDDSFTTILGVVIFAMFTLIVIVKSKKLGKEVKLPEEQKEYFAPVKVEDVELFGETVTLENGKRKDGGEKPRSFGREDLENIDKNPFDF